jgi:hypothetical protein
MKFAELSQPVKDRLLEQAASMLDYEWWEYVYGDFSTIAECFGFGITRKGINHLDIYFRGFSSQGDGASFGAVWDIDGAIDVKERLAFHTTTDETLNALAARMYEECSGMMGVSEMLCHGIGLRLGIKASDSHYPHSGTMRINTPSHTTLDFYGYESGDLHEAEVIERCDAFDEAILDIAKELADWLYKQLGAEYDYLTSEECLAERGIDYDEDGVELEEVV